MGGHHLIMGELIDVLTGQPLADTHDERYRQKIARLLIGEKGFKTGQIQAGRIIEVRADERKGLVVVSFIVTLADQAAMLIQYGPGSMVTRYRPALALSRLVAPHQIPVVVVTNGETADILDGATGCICGKGLNAIPTRRQLARRVAARPFEPITGQRAAMEARIAFAYEVDGRCPCDTIACQLDGTPNDG